MMIFIKHKHHQNQGARYIMEKQNINQDDENIIKIFSSWLTVANNVLGHYEKLITAYPDKMALHIVNNSLNHHRDELVKAIEMVREDLPAKEIESSA
ncbi:MAG: hypothetical protein K8R25_03390 [Methanosarcinales archaeon]|nr:hypothetical protein [Methanosarcinales archaeon]